jgi:hypothetical protein
MGGNFRTEYALIAVPKVLSRKKCFIFIAHVELQKGFKRATGFSSISDAIAMVEAVQAEEKELKPAA